MSYKSLLSVICFGAFINSTYMNLSQAAGYTITDLGTLGDATSFANAINESGQITGYSVTTTPPTSFTGFHAFIYSDGIMHDLDVLGSPYDINNLGHITGTRTRDNDHAFIYDGINLKDLGTLGGDTSRGTGINDLGMVAGYSSTGDATHAFLYDPDADSMQDLGTLGGAVSVGLDINNSGQVTGYAENANGEDRAFIYDPATDTMFDLGTLGDDELSFKESKGRSINDYGHVTGETSVSSIYSGHAFLYDGDTMHDLHTLTGWNGHSSNGYAINNLGHIVGEAQLWGTYDAFLYDGNSLRDLCLLTDCASKGWIGWPYQLTAVDINDNGDITGTGEIGGERHGYLIAWTDQPIPEICTDGIDNDDDGFADCKDVEDCGQDQRCYVPPGMVYQLIDLGTLGSNYSSGESINNSGQITGISRTADSVEMHAFLYENGEMRDLGFVEAGDYVARGKAINDDGHITGWSGIVSEWGEYYVKAYLYDGNTMQNLQPLLNNFCSVGSKGYDVNNNGKIVGYCYDTYDSIWGETTGSPFLYDGGTMHDLGALGITSSLAINDNGHITGSYSGRAYIYNGRNIRTLNTEYSSVGYDINDEGHVTGSLSSSDDYQLNKNNAFLYDGNTIHNLGHLGGESSQGYAVNENGQVVGESKLIGGYPAAFLYDNGWMLSLCAITDCITRGWTALISANDINDQGEITGYGEINGETHAFLAKPVTANDTDEDGIDDTLDNCTLVPNPAQRDTDSDGYGNLCDADFDNNDAINFADLGYMKSVFFTPDAEADLNGDGAVNFADLGLLKSMFFQTPGPSGLVP